MPDLTSPETNNNEGNADAPKNEENRPLARSTKWQRAANLFMLALVELLGGFTFSLLSPFYTKEAGIKGVSVTAAGIVSQETVCS